MSIIHYRQWPARRLHDLAAGANDPSSQWLPPVDIREEADRFVISADLPGIDPQEIEVQMEKGILTIKGERKPAVAAGDARYSRAERRHGAFHRRFALPDSADAEGIVASGGNGVLEVSIPKKAETAPRRIQVAAPTVQ
ncbi:MAG TPA: Hsp20/alpha crystallin family protein [Luteimonas sp.]|nr:Hsp20/alpha crystallin family protein [Luteimonas sp.]